MRQRTLVEIEGADVVSHKGKIARAYLEPLRGRLRNDNPIEELGTIRIIEAKFVTGTPADPICLLRATGRVCEQHFVAAVLRDVDLSIYTVPRNGRST